MYNLIETILKAVEAIAKLIGVANVDKLMNEFTNDLIKFKGFVLSLITKLGGKVAKKISSVYQEMKKDDAEYRAEGENMVKMYRNSRRKKVYKSKKLLALIIFWYATYYWGKVMIFLIPVLCIAFSGGQAIVAAVGIGVALVLMVITVVMINKSRTILRYCTK